MIFYLLLTIILLIGAPAVKAESFSFTQPPSYVIIPTINLSLPVFEAKVAFNTWEVRLDGASFGEGTNLPGTFGNTVIFSHALPHLFGDIPKLKKGDLIHIFTDVDWFVYTVKETAVVDPENIEVIFSKGHPELTLYTCTGKNYTKRFIIKAELST